MNTQQDIIDSLPEHLRAFVAYQDYSRYTARDHAVWRFLLKQLAVNLRQSAHPIYVEGLARTGINTETIPRIEDMNKSLQAIGWRAVVVDGFLPPAIFMEFQALKVLVIAVDMRSIEHMLYTPAPDIVHESAGHAPFLIDIDYAEFLQRFGELGMRAIATKSDLDVYESIRHLSIVKAAIDSTQSHVEEAQQRLDATIKANSVLSEAALLARLHWWTVEYGLVGELDDYRIFGAGLLSSLGESVNCLNDQRVKKISLTVDAIKTGYDITCEQPQLFVAKSCRHLSKVLEEFGRNMAFHLGGPASLQQAIDSKTVNTARLDSGVEVSGLFNRLIKDAVGNAIYFSTSGASQLAYQGVEISGHGVSHHNKGFGSPIGRLKNLDASLSLYTVDELKLHDVSTGKLVTLEFLSGITVSGKLNTIVRRDQKNILLSFEACTVTNIAGEKLFDPDWGVYDMVVGDSIASVYGGSADPLGFPQYDVPTEQTVFKHDYSSELVGLFSLYEQVCLCRQKHLQHREQRLDLASVQALVTQIAERASDEWLLQFEALELAMLYQIDDKYSRQLMNRLKTLGQDANQDDRALIQYGLQRLEMKDSREICAVESIKGQEV
jgi:phenylalanine-4-hydroxylase